MPAKPNPDLRRLTRLPAFAGLSDLASTLRDALPEASPLRGRPGQDAGTLPDGMTAMRGVMASLVARPRWMAHSFGPADPPAQKRGTEPHQIVDESSAWFGALAALKPGAPLCEMGAGLRPAVAPPLPEGARFEEATHRGAAGALAYKLYVPSSFAGRAMPLVVMLHGCTQSPDDFAAGTRMNEVAEEQGFLVAYPRQVQGANAQKCWNWFDGRGQDRDRGEPALIAGLTREIMRDFAVDETRVYVAGLSAGGAAAAIVAQCYPDLYAAVGVHSGLARGAATDMPSAFAAMRQGGVPTAGRAIPTIVFHGDGDRTVHPSNGGQVAAQGRGGAVLTAQVTRGRSPGGLAYTRAVETDASGLPAVEHWLLHGAGHAWSGGSAAGSYTEPRGPDASREMVRFFLAHERAG